MSRRKLSRLLLRVERPRRSGRVARRGRTRHPSGVRNEEAEHKAQDDANDTKENISRHIKPECIYRGSPCLFINSDSTRERAAFCFESLISTGAFRR
jgi:hypothetical protein